jgi:hypothetical protein
MTFTRNGSRWVNENEYNQWAVNETESILDNVETLYLLKIECLEKNYNNRLKRLIRNTMISENIKVKNKNVIQVFKELKESQN